jgi:hypothetical protein
MSRERRLGFGRGPGIRADVRPRCGDVAEAVSRRVRLIATDDFGSESEVIGEPTHVGSVVERFVGRKAEGVSGVENEFCILLVSHDDVCSGFAGSRKGKSSDVVGRRLGAIDNGVMVGVGYVQTVSEISSSVAQVNEGGEFKEVAGEVGIPEDKRSELEGGARDLKEPSGDGADVAGIGDLEAGAWGQVGIRGVVGEDAGIALSK